MGFWDFFKKKQESEIKEKEEISFNQIKKWINRKEEKTTDLEKNILIEIKQIIDFSKTDINKYLEKLKNTEIALEKPEGRVETIVKENLENYISSVENLIKEVSNIEKKESLSLLELINKINKAFSYFEKKSYVNYQKASYLVKKELIETNKSVMNLSKELKEVFDRNKELINKSKNISEIKQDLDIYEKTSQGFIDLDRKISLDNTNLDKLNNEKQKVFDKIKSIKNTKDYLDNLEQIARKDSLEIGFEKEVLNLKALIDFKALTSVFHHDKKRLEVIRNYKENFYNFFIQDKEKIISLISEAGMKNNKIDEKFNEILKKEDELEEIKKSLIEDPTIKLEKEIKKIDLEIDKINSEIVLKNKNLEKIYQRKKEIKEKIKKDVEKIGGIILDSNKE